MHQQEKCPDCGTIPDDWLDDNGEAVEPPPYKVVDLRCLGCVSKADQEDMIPAKSRKGVHFYFRRWNDGDSYG